MSSFHNLKLISVKMVHDDHGKLEHPICEQTDKQTKKLSVFTIRIFAPLEKAILTRQVLKKYTTKKALTYAKKVPKPTSNCGNK